MDPRQSEFISRRIPIAAVRSSRWCRAVDTARLLDLGTVRLTPVLESVFNAYEQLADRKKRTTENIIDLTGIVPATGAAVVMRADAQEHIRVKEELEASIPDRYTLNITMQAADPLMNS